MHLRSDLDMAVFRYKTWYPSISHGFAHRHFPQGLLPPACCRRPTVLPNVLEYQTHQTNNASLSHTQRQHNMQADIHLLPSSPGRINSTCYVSSPQVDQRHSGKAQVLSCSVDGRPRPAQYSSARGEQYPEEQHVVAGKNPSCAPLLHLGPQQFQVSDSTSCPLRCPGSGKNACDDVYQR